jgi:hypothetical protein
MKELASTTSNKMNVALSKKIVTITIQKELLMASIDGNNTLIEVMKQKTVLPLVFPTCCKLQLMIPYSPLNIKTYFLFATMSYVGLIYFILTEITMLMFHLQLYSQNNVVEILFEMDGSNIHREYHGCRRHIPIVDLNLHRELVICEENIWDLYLYPCTKCYGGHRYNIRTVQVHLRQCGRDLFLMHSMVERDPLNGYTIGGIWVHEGREYDLDTNVFDDANMSIEYRNHLDPFHDIQQHLFDIFDLADRLQKDTPHVFEDDGDTNEVDNENTKYLADLDALYRERTQLVYNGSTISIILATIVLINMVVIHGVSNAYVDELFKYLTTILLSGDNKLLKSHYKAKKLTCKLGLQYHVIQTCPEGCVLYRDEYKNLDKYGNQAVACLSS